MPSNNQIIDGEIHVYDRFGYQKLRKIEFYNAYVVRFVENYDLECNPSLINTVTLYPGIININNASKHKTPWNDWLHGDKESSKKNKTPIAAPIPTITPIQWIDAESGNRISEIRYGQQVSLRTRIDHAEDSTATITIRKKDGTPFESGKSQFNFTEEITNDGKITLDPFEIKSLWEEAGDDEPIALIAEISHCGHKKSSGELTLLPTPKVLVNFRPAENYHGEYGFDWIRMGDTDKKGDKWYKEIIGKYDEDTYTFKQDDKQYTNLGKEFELLDHPIKAEDKYVVPVLALLPNKKATLTLKVEIAHSDACAIEFKYNTTYIKLNSDIINQTKKGKHHLGDELIIECIKEFNKDEFIEVFADGKFAGKLKILANDKTHRYKADILFVKVITQLIKGVEKKGIIRGRKEEFSSYFNQALAKAKYEEVELDLRFDKNFNNKFSYKGNFFAANTNEFQKYLNKALEKEFGNTYDNYYKVYFIDEEQGGLFGQAYDIPAPKKYRSVIVLRPGFFDATVAHEVLHAMGLYHTFDNNSTFTFEEYKTDNIMDYSDIGPEKIPVTSTATWQWKILHENLDNE